MNPYVDPAVWRGEALAYHVQLIDQADPAYAMRAADDAEKASEGILHGLGQRVRREIEKRQVAA